MGWRSRKVRKSSSRADQSFQALKRHFWFSVYASVVDFVDGQSHRVQYASDPPRRSVLWKQAHSRISRGTRPACNYAVMTPCLFQSTRPARDATRKARVVLRKANV